MHIHAGHMNPQPSLGGAQASALAARRAEETRKKLFTASAEIDALSSSESAWMVTAWAGGSSAGGSSSGGSLSDENPAGNSNGHSTGNSTSEQQTLSQSSNQYSGHDRQVLEPIASAEIERTPHAPAAGPVSFWA